jgi:transposase
MTMIRPLAEGERRELKRLARQEVGRVSERLHMILLASRGYSVTQVAAIFECEAGTVRQWIARFEAEGVAGLRDRPRAGRPRKADRAAQDVIRQQVAQPPAAAGYRIGYWTVGTLTAHLVRACGLHVSRATVRRVVRALGYVWGRPRHVLPQDPDVAAKMWALCAQVLRSAPDAVLLCLDECDLHLLPVLRALWQPAGQQTDVPTPGSNRKRSLFGALEWTSGRWSYLLREHKRADDFVAFLEQLSLTYPTVPLLLVLDNASIHHAQQVTRWLEGHARVQLLYLPTYSGHRENPVEKVWWRLKDQVAANRLYGSIDALVEAVHCFFTSFSPEDARRLTA